MLRSAGSLGESIDLIQRTLAERYNRASSRFDATDARPCVPTKGYSYRSCVPIERRLTLTQRTHDRASLHRVTRTDRASQ